MKVSSRSKNRRPARNRAAKKRASAGPSLLKQVLFPDQLKDQRRDSFAARAFVFVLFIPWTIYFFSLDYNADHELSSSFMHRINLVFHEAGHVIFRPFGRFMMILGGSLFQVLLPVIVSAVLLLQKRDAFGAGLGIWWCGQSLKDICPYIADARSGTLPLLGGNNGTDSPHMHDWRNILSELGMLKWDHYVAHKTSLVAGIVMLLGLSWSFLALRQEWRERD